MQRIAHVYLKMNQPEKAIAYLEEMLDRDKENEKNSNAYFAYSSYICIDLIKNLIKLKDYKTAKRYALELIHYEEPDIYKEDNSFLCSYLCSCSVLLFIYH